MTTPPTPEQIDRRFHYLEEFAADSSSNLAIVERVRRLRMDVRSALGLKPLKPRKEASDD